MQMATRFTVVRYRPDSLRDECRNIGLVAWSRSSWAERLVDGLPSELAEYARFVMVELRARIAALPEQDRIDHAANTAILARFDGPYAGVIFRHELGSSIFDGDAEATLNHLWEVCFNRHDGYSPYGRWVWSESPAEFAGAFIIATSAPSDSD
jgi:hypothetical protein